MLWLGALARVARIGLGALVERGLVKSRELSRRASSRREARQTGRRGVRFVARTCYSLASTLRRVRRCLAGLGRDGVHVVAIYGATEAAEFLVALAPAYGVRVSGIYDDYAGDQLVGWKVRRVIELVGTRDVVVIATVARREQYARVLEWLRIGAEKIRYV